MLRGVGARVRLGQHGGRGLKKCVVLRHTGAFGRDVHVRDPTHGGHKIGFLSSHFLTGELQPRHRRSVIGAKGRDVFNCLSEDTNGNVGQVDRCARICSGEGYVVSCVVITVLLVVTCAFPVCRSSVSIVSAERRRALLTLTIGPVFPSELTNTLTVLSRDLL